MADADRSRMCSNPAMASNWPIFFCHIESGLNNLSGGDCGGDAGLFLSQDRSEHLKEQRQKCSEMGEDLADVVTAGAEDGKNCVADAAFQRTSGEPTVGFHVADLGLDGAAPFQELGQ